MSRFLVSCAAIGFLVLVPTHRAHAQAAQAAARAQGAARKERNEQHPRIHAAIKELEEAKKELQAAPHDFGGHRADAVQAVDKALEQLRLALQYDKK
jgi:multidrug efflux pump subunit AcrA (membrane-fusion protein)